MIIEIPGYKTLDLDYLVLDYNGTIAVDGLIPPAIKERLLLLGDSFKIYVLTADTHGTAAAMCDGLPLEIMTFPSGSAMNEKLRILSSLGAEHCIAIGNCVQHTICQWHGQCLAWLNGIGSHIIRPTKRLR